MRPVAYAGEERGYLGSISVTWDESLSGRGPMGSAIRLQKRAVVRYAYSDATFTPWCEEARKRGYVSVLSLPLVTEGRAIGTLGIYSTELDAFGYEHSEHLAELGCALSEAITRLRSNPHSPKT